jgi:tripartite motif-containing protein 71
MNLRIPICLSAIVAAAMLLNGCASTSSGTSQQAPQKTFVYVSDYDNGVVQVFDSNGNYVSQISQSFSNPLSVATDPQGNLYVKNEADTSGGSGCAVDKFDSKGNLLLEIGACAVVLGGTGPGIFDNVGQVATDTAGNLWISSADYYYIQKFDGSGNFLNVICMAPTVLNSGSCTMATPQEEQPTIVAADGNGNVYTVPDPNFSFPPNLILKFDSTGTYQGPYGNPGNFSTISGLAFDASNNMYVADSGNLVQKFDSNGNYLSQFGSAGSAPGDFAGPPGAIALDHAGNAYVLDPLGYRVLVFDSNGNYVREFGSQGQGNGQFTRPTGIAVAQ